MKPNEQQVWKILEGVADPEIPVVSIVELGMVREINIDEAGKGEVVMSPTYTGCPATDAIRRDVNKALQDAGFGDLDVRYKLTPPWTTDWITDAAKQKLQDYGIAPPQATRGGAITAVPCPRCRSTDTEVISDFGSTPCKASMRCKACLEPFEHFKCH